MTKPARYLGEEYNSIHKDHGAVDVTFALAFPDTYEVGMSHLGLRLLYHVLNQREDTACERVFAPWIDMAEQMRQSGTPLWALESGRPVVEFDILGISLQHELNFTNALYLMDLAGIPLASADRGPDQPLVVAGGPAAFNPEPMADFFDLIVVGDGEAAAGQLVDLVRRHGRDRPALLQEAAAAGGPAGFYVPSLYRPTYGPSGELAGVSATEATARPVIAKALVPDIGAVTPPDRPLVPFLDVVHDRITLEVCRGCTRGCRFCQAGMIYRPVRERSRQDLLDLAERQVRSTGHEEISLSSLSATDYSEIGPLVTALIERHGGRGIGVALPSLRTDAFSVDLAAEIQKVRKSGLTFAPEAGTERLRRVINKNVTEGDLLDAVSAAFRKGWDRVKLYFMIGLPTETDEDVLGIADLARRVWACHAELRPGRGLRLTVSCASFVPKAHTPFQWDGQAPLAELERRQSLLRAALPRRIKLSWHDARQSFIEAVLARGDRRLGPAVAAAYRRGCRFDAWDEHFQFDEWTAALDEVGIIPAEYANRERDRDEVLPWDHIHTGVDRDYLWRERQRALRGEQTADCRLGECHACGVCPAFGATPRLASGSGAGR